MVGLVHVASEQNVIPPSVVMDEGLNAEQGPLEEEHTAHEPEEVAQVVQPVEQSLLTQTFMPSSCPEAAAIRPASVTKARRVVILAVALCGCGGDRHS